MDFDAFAAELKEMLQIPEEATPDLRLEGKGWWDSMAYLYIITYAEEKFGLDLSFDDLKPVSTLGGIHSLLTGKS